MADLRITTTRGTDTVLDEATVQGFTSRVRGPLLRPGDAGYDAARKLYNGMIDRHPALIVRCAGVADVLAAVNFARAHAAVRGSDRARGRRYQPGGPDGDRLQPPPRAA
jgi:hypothetical protein